MGVGHLAKQLIPLLQNYEVIGLSRSFSQRDIKQVDYTSGSSFPKEVPEDPLAVIWNFPPHPEYVSSLQKADLFFTKKTPYLIVSSTSIYSSGLVQESSPMNSKSRMYEVEKYLASSCRPKKITRPAGLFDSERHPGLFFKNATVIENSQNPVNMTHTKDLARFLVHLLNKPFDKEQDVYNVLSSTHPTKKEFYSLAMSLKNNLTPVMNPGQAPAKKVCNQKSLDTGFEYIYDDLLAALKKI